MGNIQTRNGFYVLCFLQLGGWKKLRLGFMIPNWPVGGGLAGGGHCHWSFVLGAYVPAIKVIAPYILCFNARDLIKNRCTRVPGNPERLAGSSCYRSELRPWTEFPAESSAPVALIRDQEMHVSSLPPDPSHFHCLPKLF